MNLRHWLIHKLARRDMIAINCVFDQSQGTSINLQYGQQGGIYNCTFIGRKNSVGIEIKDKR